MRNTRPSARRPKPRLPQVVQLHSQASNLDKVIDLRTVKVIRISPKEVTVVYK